MSTHKKKATFTGRGKGVVHQVPFIHRVSDGIRKRVHFSNEPFSIKYSTKAESGQTVFHTVVTKWKIHVYQELGGQICWDEGH